MGACAWYNRGIARLDAKTCPDLRQRPAVKTYLSLLHAAPAWFAHPALLWSLAIVPLVALVGVYAWLRRRRAVARLGLSPRSVPARRRYGRAALALAGLLLLALACAGPQWGHDTTQGQAPVRDLAIVLDLSRSMDAEQPSRRERAVRALRDLADDLERRGGIRVALIAAAGRARLLFPLTQDDDHLRHALTRIEAGDLPPLTPGPEESLVSGTRLGAGIDLAVKALSSPSPGSQAVLLLSDGDDPAGDREWLDAVQRAHAVGLPVHAVGLGDPLEDHSIPADGGPLRHLGKIVKSRLHEDVLEEIARRTGGTYLPARTGAIPLGALVRALLENAPPRDVGEALPVVAQRSAWFLLPALALLALALLLGDHTAARPAPAGTAVGLLALAVVGGMAPADLNELLRQGNEAFARQDYAQALKLYAQAEGRGDDPGLIEFNRGLACYRLQDYGAAAVHFRRCLDDEAAPLLRRARAAFDLGNALVRQSGADDAAGLRQAVAAYRACLAQGKLDADLWSDARHNLELAQLLWQKARARGNPDEPPDGPEHQSGAKKKEEGKGTEQGREPSGQDTETQEPDGSKKNGQAGVGQEKSSRRVARGPLGQLPDQDQLAPLTTEDAAEHLRRIAERIARERRGYYRQQRPAPGVAPDW